MQLSQPSGLTLENQWFTLKMYFCVRNYSNDKLFLPHYTALRN